jgi:hypothetical protein
LVKYFVGGSGAPVQGDPQFALWNGENVHGRTGAAFSIISAPELALNARFQFLPTGRPALPPLICRWPPPCLQMALVPPTMQTQPQIRDANGDTDGEMFSTAFWSHSGNYLSEIGVLLKSPFVSAADAAAGGTVASHAQLLRVEVRAGAWEHGFAVNGEPLRSMASHRIRRSERRW